MTPGSLSIIIPCYNEEGNIANTVSDLTEALKDIITDYEMLVFDDCSTDGTKAVIERLAAADPKIRPVFNPVNKGLGYNYRTGVKLASKEHVIMVPGDNEIVARSVAGMCTHLGEADIIIPYVTNTAIRPLKRRIISTLYTLILNTLFWKRIRYYNGPVLYKRAVLNKARMTSDGFAYQAEILIQLSRMGHSYSHCGILLQPRLHGGSRALTGRNLRDVCSMVISLTLRKK